MKLLFINACVREKNSRTLRLAMQYIQSVSQENDMEIARRDLWNEEIQFLRKDDFDDNGECTYPYNTDLAREFAEADQIVIAAPFWEFEFPAILNTYIEMVSKAEITFCYTNYGSCGLCKAKQLTYIYTAGGFLKDEEKIGEMKLRQLSKLYGIEKFHVVYADGLDVVPENADAIVNRVLEEIR